MSEAPSKSAFIAALMAPLGPDVEPAMAGDFAKEFRQAAKERWRHGIVRIWQLEALENFLLWSHEIIMTEHGRDEKTLLAFRSQAFNRRVEAVDRQMRMQAPTVRELKWKKDWRKFGGCNPGRDAAIAFDEEFFAKFPARKRQMKAACGTAERADGGGVHD